MLGCCQLLVRFYELLNLESQFFSPVAKAELPELGQRLVGLYSWLAADAARAGHRQWKLAPKFHLFLHLCEWQAVEQGNPRYYWCYSDEDLAGLMAEVAESCHPATLPETALFKWLHISFGEE